MKLDRRHRARTAQEAERSARNGVAVFGMPGYVARGGQAVAHLPPSLDSVRMSEGDVAVVAQSLHRFFTATPLWNDGQNFVGVPFAEEHTCSPECPPTPHQLVTTLVFCATGLAGSFYVDPAHPFDPDAVVVTPGVRWPAVAQRPVRPASHRP